MIRRRCSPRLALIVLVAWTAACQTPGPAARKPRAGEKAAPQAFFWEAQAPGGGRLYLLGSVHVGDGRALALDPRIESDWAAAEELVVELDMTAPSPVDAVEATNRHGLLPKPRTLREVVRADTYKQVAQYMKKREYSMDHVDQMRPWMVALVVQDLEYSAAGWRAENGVDALMIERARGKKPIQALESLDEQMSAFAGLPDRTQETWLTDVLRESQQLLDFTREMLHVWEAGDDARMSTLLFPEASTQADQQQFYDRVYWSRNRIMADRLTALVADGKPRFVVVGTGHLLGALGIPALLAARGFQVDRLGSAHVVGGSTQASAPPAAATPHPAVEPPQPTAVPTLPAEPTVERPVPAPPATAPAPATIAAPSAPGPAEPVPSPPGLAPLVPAQAPPTTVPLRAPADVHDQWLGQDADAPAQAPPPPSETPPPPPKAVELPAQSPAAPTGTPAPKPPPAVATNPAAKPAPAPKAKGVAVAKQAAKAKASAKAKPAAKTKPSAKAKPVAKTKPAAKAKVAGKAKPAANAKPAARVEPGAKASPVVKGKPPAKAAAKPRSAPNAAAKHAPAPAQH